MKKNIIPLLVVFLISCAGENQKKKANEDNQQGSSIEKNRQVKEENVMKIIYYITEYGSSDANTTKLMGDSLSAMKVVYNTLDSEDKKLIVGYIDYNISLVNLFYDKLSKKDFTDMNTSGIDSKYAGFKRLTENHYIKLVIDTVKYKHNLNLKLIEAMPNYATSSGFKHDLIQVRKNLDEIITTFTDAFYLVSGNRYNNL
jgi:hypothetical protein